MAGNDRMMDGKKEAKAPLHQSINKLRCETVAMKKVKVVWFDDLPVRHVGLKLG